MLISSVSLRYAFNKVRADVFRVLLFSLGFHALKVIVGKGLPDIPEA